MAIKFIGTLTRREASDHHGISSVGVFFIIVAVFLVCGVTALIVHAHLRARRLGLPPPTLSSYLPNSLSSSSRNYPSTSSGGVVGWFNDKFQAIKNRRNRTAGGAYEEPLSGIRGRRGGDALDPDEAWDTRVGTEADAYGPGGHYEEQELGLHGDGAGHYGGGGYGVAPTAELPAYGEDQDGRRGRSRSRDPTAYIGGSHEGLDARYDQETGRRPSQNPFGDQAEPSDMGLRGVSPRPMEAEYAPGVGEEHQPEHKSIFREHNG